MKYTNEERTRILKETFDLVNSKDFHFTYEQKLKYQEMVNKDIEKYYAECKREGIDPLTCEQKVTDEQLKRRFDC